MARKRASMREGPLAELFRKTEAAQRAQDAPAEAEPPEASEPEDELSPRARAALEATVEHVHDFEEEPATRPSRRSRLPVAAAPEPEPEASDRGRSLARGGALLPDDARARPAASSRRPRRREPHISPRSASSASAAPG